MKNTNFLLLIFVMTSWISNLEAYVQNRSESDKLVSWAKSINTIDVYVNPTNQQNIDNNDIRAIVTSALTQWNGKSRIILRQNSTPVTNTDGLNEIYFSSDPSIFSEGTGVVGVTQVYLKNATGEILDADILINDLTEFTTIKTGEKYLGNVISHEIGHLLGLGHSQVADSTMFFTLSKGQSELADDDKAGVFSLYPIPGLTTKGSLSGKIVGGKSLIGVFGAHVEAISLKTGRVAGASISDLDGTFLIGGLDRNDRYFLYTKPIFNQGLASRYNNARFDFCSSSVKYRGSFFQSCSASKEGYPQSVNLNSANVEVGNVTIRCGIDVPVDYIKHKDTTTAAFDLNSGVTSGVGNSFVGFFFPREIENEKIDYFKISYSGVDWNSISLTGDLYVELKVLNQSFYSPFKANVAIERNSEVTSVTPNYVLDVDGSINIDTVARIKVNRASSSDNDFIISVHPESMKSPRFPSSFDFLRGDHSPFPENFQDSLYFYLVTVSIVKETGVGTYSQVSYKDEVITDNSSCPDAKNTYALTSYSAIGTPSSSTKKKEDGIACGTVDLNSNSGNGPGGFFIGLIFSLIMCSLTSSIIKQYKAKHYSKLA